MHDFSIPSLQKAILFSKAHRLKESSPQVFFGQTYKVLGHQCNMDERGEDEGIHTYCSELVYTNVETVEGNARYKEDHKGLPYGVQRVQPKVPRSVNLQIVGGKLEIIQISPGGGSPR